MRVETAGLVPCAPGEEKSLVNLMHIDEIVSDYLSNVRSLIFTDTSKCSSIAQLVERGTVNP